MQCSVFWKKKTETAREKDYWNNYLLLEDFFFNAVNMSYT